MNIVRKILKYYCYESPGLKKNLIHIVNNGSLKNKDKVIILPVDQGFEHGPEASFSLNPLGYDPEYHVKIALRGGVNAFAGPLGMIESISNYNWRIPLILKLNSSNSLTKNKILDQSFTSSITDAVRLGCLAIGLTIYPGSSNFNEMVEEAREAIKEARSYGLPSIVWSYPRGGELKKEEETSLETISYGAHIASLIGAHIIKVKIPQSHDRAKEELNKIVNLMKLKTEYIKQIILSSFVGKRIVLFSGGPAKNNESIYDDVKAIKNGGGHGSIIGRNIFQRSEKQAIELLKNIINIYKS